MPDVYPAPSPFLDLDLVQLLNWPDIRLTIQLDYLEFTRIIYQNCDRELVFGDDVMVNLQATKNPTVTRYVEKVRTTKTYSMVSKDLFAVYLTSLMEAAPNYEVGPSKLPEIEQAFRKVIDDVNSVPNTSIQTKVTHSRFLNDQKYFCIFDGDGNANSDGLMRVRLRETINPEVNFDLVRCTFTSDKTAMWQSKLHQDLEDILIKRSSEMKSTLRDRFKKCLVLKCEICNESFEGPLWVVKLKDHIRQKHFVPRHWNCVKCLRQWNQFELLQMGWKHNCNQTASNT